MTDIPEDAVKQYRDSAALKLVKQIIVLFMQASSLVLNSLFCFLPGSNRDARLYFAFSFTFLHAVFATSSILV